MVTLCFWPHPINRMEIFFWCTHGGQRRASKGRIKLPALAEPSCWHLLKTYYSVSCYFFSSSYEFLGGLNLGLSGLATSPQEATDEGLPAPWMMGPFASGRKRWSRDSLRTPQGNDRAGIHISRCDSQEMADISLIVVAFIVST